MSNSAKREKDKPQPIQVFIRSRPFNKQECEARSTTSIEILNSKDLMVKQQYGKRYTFDKIFGPNAKQIDVYRNVVKPLIPEVLAGYNCTVFAYGQTGTGKTYTMAGGSAPSKGISWEDDEEAGIIPRAMAHLFDDLSLIQQQYTVRVSYLELYNEELFDLLSDNIENKNIRLFEDQQQKGSVIINGISTETVHSKREVYNILQKGQEKRRTASTLLNAQSSRSHTVFMIMVHTCETTVDGEELVKTGKLNLVDLAGSENISRSGAMDKRAREAGNINQSLLTLGRVIKALVEKSAHIPYRESKLTRILQDSLGGRTKTSIIATISPATACLEETLSTLDYAHRAKHITNKPEINQRLSQKAWKAQYEKEMDRLRKDLLAARTGTGIYIDQENYDRLITDSQICRDELNEKINIVRDLEQQLQNMEEEKEMKEAEWIQIQLSFETTRNKLDHYRQVLKKTTVEKKEQEYLASCYEAKAGAIHDQAQHLVKMTQTTVTNFQKKMSNLFAVSQENSNKMKMVSKEVINICQEIVNELLCFMLNYKKSNERMSNDTGTLLQEHSSNYEATEQFGNMIAQKTQNFVDVAYQQFEEAFQSNKSSLDNFQADIMEKLKNIEKITQCIEFKVQLEQMRKELLSDIHQTGDDLATQRVLICDSSSELKMIKDEMSKVSNSINLITDRLGSLEGKIRESERINQACTENLSKAHEFAINKIDTLVGATESKNNQAATILNNTYYIVNELPKGEKLETNIKKLRRCCHQPSKEENVEHEAETNSSNVMEEKLKDLMETSNKLVESNKTMMLHNMTKITEMQNLLSQLCKVSLKHEIVMKDKLEECQDNLTSFINNGLIELSPGSSTPCHLQFDPNMLAYPSPKERILMRFRNSSIGESLNDSMQFDDIISPLVERNIIRSNLIKPNVLYNQFNEQNESELSNKENLDTN